MRIGTALLTLLAVGPDGGGGTHTQGALLCGAMFDNPDANNPGRCLAEITNHTLNENDLTFSFARAKKAISIDVNCPGKWDGQKSYRDCKIKDKTVCDPTGKVIVMRGSTNSSQYGGTVDLDKQDTLLLACAADVGLQGQEFGERNGAIGKCLKWFKVEPDPDRTYFLTCLRAARADYCGCGQSYTLQGILIQLGMPEPAYDWKNKCDELASGCLEAGWSKGRAICLARQRLDELQSRSTMLVRRWLSLNGLTGHTDPKNRRKAFLATFGRSVGECMSECDKQVAALLATPSQSVSDVGPRRICEPPTDPDSEMLLYNRSWHHNASGKSVLCDKSTHPNDWDPYCPF